VNGSGWQGVGWLDQMDEYTNSRDMDYIARHGYWDHPRHGWGPSACYHHRHMLETLPHDSLVEYFASRRPSHIPFTITEWNQCSPNDQLLEAVPIMACYGALQDWSMLLHYRMDFPDWLLASDIAFNPESPTMLYQYPIAAYAFLHGYIKPGDIVWRNTIPDVFDIDRIKGKETEYTLKPEHPAGYLSVGEHALVGRCENVYGDEESFQADITPFRSQDGAMIRSITGELQWRGGASPLLTVNAAKMRGFAGRVDRDVIELGGLRIHVTPGTHASIFVIALDNRSLEESKSMLLSIVGPVSLVDRGALVKAEQVGRDGGPLYKIQPQGRLPIMMKEVAGFIEFDKSVQRACQLDVSGRPKANAGVEEQGRRLPFSNHGSIWYEISR
jgi:hypothetical protein